MKLLVVDDEPDVTGFLHGHFVRKGLKVLVAHDFRRALDLVRRERPEIVFLDVRLPEVDGIELLKRIRRLDGRCRVFMLTQVDDQLKRDKVHALGISGYFTKPIHLDELDQEIMPIIQGY